MYTEVITHTAGGTDVQIIVENAAALDLSQEREAYIGIFSLKFCDGQKDFACMLLNQQADLSV